MGTYIMLLRGINVGGHNKLPMKDLSAMFEAAGCDDVRTYIQSGNVIFSATKALTRHLPEIIHASIAEQFGYDIPLVLRSADQIAAIVEANPFTVTAPEERLLHVAFLRETPSAEAVATLDPGRSPQDEFVVNGSEIYIRFDEGVANSKLTNAYFDARLKTVSTARNWRTTKKLLELATD